MSVHDYCEYNCGGTTCGADERPRRQATVKLDAISREAVKKMDEIVKNNRRFTDIGMKWTIQGAVFIAGLFLLGLADYLTV